MGGLSSSYAQQLLKRKEQLLQAKPKQASEGTKDNAA